MHTMSRALPMSPSAARDSTVAPASAGTGAKPSKGDPSKGESSERPTGDASSRGFGQNATGAELLLCLMGTPLSLSSAPRLGHMLCKSTL